MTNLEKTYNFKILFKCKLKLSCDFVHVVIILFHLLLFHLREL